MMEVLQNLLHHLESVAVLLLGMYVYLFCQGDEYSLHMYDRFNIFHCPQTLIHNK